MNTKLLINKQDYLNSFYLCKELWFVKSDLIRQNMSSSELDDEESFDNDNSEIIVYLNEIIKDSDDVTIIEGKIIGIAFKSFIKKNYGSEYEIIDLSKFLSVQEAASKTKDLIDEANKTQKNIIVFEACFLNNTTVTRTDAFIYSGSRQTLEFIECKGSSRIKAKYLYDVNFQYQVIRQYWKNNYKKELPITNILLSLINSNVDIDPDLQKKGNISFRLVDFYSTTKSGNKPDEIKNQLNILDLFKSDKAITKISKTNDLFESEEFWIRIDEVLEQKKQHFLINDFDVNNQIPILHYQENICKSKIGDCQYWSSCRKSILSKKYPILQNTGYLTARIPEYIILDNDIDELRKDLKVKNGKFGFLLFSKEEESFSTDFFPAFGEWSEHDNLLWYDFETINPAMIAIDRAKPFQQVITQCSIAQTKNYKLVGKVNNLIVDPQKITIEWLKEVIDGLYKPELENLKYVVYFAPFEKNVLEKMKSIIDDLDYTNKIQFIQDRTIDLELFFNINSTRGHPIKLKALNGFSSIKIVTEYIKNNYPNLLSECNVVDYGNLNIQNGLQAMSLTKKRFFGFLSDDAWKKTAADLEKYCENDVLAMICVWSLLQTKVKEHEVKFNN